MSPIATRVSEHRRSHEPTLHKPNLTRRRDKLPFADVSPAVLDPLDPVVNEPFSERGPSGEYKVLEQPLGMRRKLKVICIGAGPSGINMAYKVQSHLRDVEFIAYEKNPEIGGTWLENRYPGVACDTNSHGYAFTYHLKADWTKVFSPGGEIQDYLKETAEYFGLSNYFRLGHQVMGARFDPTRAKWHVTIDHQGRQFEENCDVLINAAGLLNNWRWPAIPRLHDFRGTLVHSATWPETLDLKGKRVAVIGAGSSAIQILPNILDSAKAVEIFIRSQTWVAPPREGALLSPETVERYSQHPEEHLEYCRELEALANRRFDYIRKGSRAQKETYDAWSKSMNEELAGRSDIYENLHPKFGVGCRRPTPGPGFLKALIHEKTRTVFTPIIEADETGLRTDDGEHHPFDVIICATGFDVSFKPRFPVTGSNGISLQDQWSDSALAYLSMFAPNFPNYICMLGPGAPSAQGSIIVSIERISDYIIKVLYRLQTEAIKTITICQSAVDELQEHTEAQLQLTVWSENCSSWFKNGNKDGKVTALHPGGRLHFFSMLMNPRWEDFEYTYWNRNRFAFLGDGYTLREREGRNDTWYLQYGDGLDLFYY